MADQELQATPKQHVESPEGEFTHEGTYFVPAVDIYENSKELVSLGRHAGSPLRGCGS